jgi:hypothetical protein
VSIRDRVILVLAAWCGTDPNSIDSSMTLQDLWASTKNSTTNPHSAIPFADGLEELLRMLVAEFKKPGLVRKDTSGFTTASFKPKGDIDTVNDLVNAVVHRPNLPSTPAVGTD